LPAFQVEGKLEVPDQGPVQAVGNAPEEKKAANQGKWKQIRIAGGGSLVHKSWFRFERQGYEKFVPQAYLLYFVCFNRVLSTKGAF
jgi:hypothetical protein